VEKALIQKKTEEKFLAWYDEHADSIFRFLLLRIRDREAAKELTQETFVRTWEYVRAGNNIDNSRAFLHRVARNALIDRVRHHHDEISLDSLAEAGFEQGDGKRAVEEMVLSMSHEHLIEALALLPDKYQEAVRLRYLDDMAVKEIAHILGETETNVSVRIHRGIGKLRELMESKGYNQEEL